MEMTDLSDFQKRFLLGNGAGQTLYTQKEFDEAVAQAKGEIMAIAIQTTKQALAIERQACAEIAHEFHAKLEGKLDDEEWESELASAILNRIAAK